MKVSIHKVTAIEPGQIRQLDGFCTRTLAVLVRPFGAAAPVIEEVTLFADQPIALKLGEADDVTQATVIAALRLELNRVQELAHERGRALAKIANVGLGRGALGEAIQIAEDVLDQDDLNLYTAELKAEEAA